MGQRLRCSLRYFPEPGGGPPTTVGWPFAWLEVSEGNLTVAAGRLVPFGRPRWTVPVDRITRVEPTQQAVRFFADGFHDPWVIASLFPNRLLATLARFGIHPEGPTKPSTWNTL
jgi:hypothetical protein